MAAAAAAVLDRAEINRANAKHSTGPRTEAGKQRSSQNALRHGLTAQSVVVPSEEEAAYQQLCHKFFGEYEPATATEATLVQLLADTSWRLNRVTQLEDVVLGDTSLAPQEAIDQISRLALYSSRLSRQFQNNAQRVRREELVNTALRFARPRNVKQLREIQDDRRRRERRELRNAADLLVQHEHQGKQWDPADDGFVFSRSQVEQFATREIRLNTARIYSSAAFDVPPQFASAYRRRVQAREHIAQ